jgi:hypothetical protein
MTAPGGLGETASAYASHAAQFVTDLHWLDELLLKHPELRCIEARIRPMKVELVTFGGPGVKRDWLRALPPVLVEDTGIYSHQSLIGMTDVLKTGHVTVTVRRPM